MLLAIPATGALSLGYLGALRRAPQLNIAFSLGTLLAACALTVRVIRHGDLLLGHEQFFLDPFNVFLVTKK